MKFATSSLITPQELNGLRINKIINVLNFVNHSRILKVKNMRLN